MKWFFMPTTPAASQGATVLYALSNVPRIWVSFSACLLLSAVLLWVALVGLFPAEVTIGVFVVSLIGALLQPATIYFGMLRFEKREARVGGRLQTAFGRDKFGARTAQGTGTMLYAEITKLTILRGFVFVECWNAKRSVTRVKETCHWSE